MISKIILKSYLSSFIKNWLVLIILLGSFESILHYLKELKNLSPLYTQSDLTYFILIDFLWKAAELSPITVFISTVITNWQWTQQSRWLAYAVIGSPKKQFFLILFFQLLIVSLITIPLKLIFLPELSYESHLTRLSKIDKIPKIQVNQVYLQNKKLFFPMEKDALFIYDFEINNSKLTSWKSKNPLLIETDDLSLDLAWELQRKIGFDKINFIKKIELYKKNIIEIKNEIFSYLIKDFAYIFLIFFSVIFSWIATPIQSIKKSAILSKLQILNYLVLLYGTLKFIPVASLMIPMNEIIFGLSILFSIAIFIPFLFRKIGNLFN